MIEYKKWHNREYKRWYKFDKSHKWEIIYIGYAIIKGVYQTSYIKYKCKICNYHKVKCFIWESDGNYGHVPELRYSNDESKLFHWRDTADDRCISCDKNLIRNVLG